MDSVTTAGCCFATGRLQPRGYVLLLCFCSFAQQKQYHDTSGVLFSNQQYMMAWYKTALAHLVSVWTKSCSTADLGLDACSQQCLVPLSEHVSSPHSLRWSQSTDDTCINELCTHNLNPSSSSSVPPSLPSCSHSSSLSLASA